jgi:hypothetical protein
MSGLSGWLITMVRRGLSAFLAICGLAALVLGLLYLKVASRLPHRLAHALGGAGHGTHHAHAWLAGGAACVIVAWLIRVRRAPKR